jgi:hypothetical protein
MTCWLSTQVSGRADAARLDAIDLALVGQQRHLAR